MSHAWALIPVKTLEHSKTRLNPVLEQNECASLSRAMFLDVLDAMNEAAGIDHIAVLTDDPVVTELAEQLGHVVIPDESAGQLSVGLNAAASKLASMGAELIVVTPGDLPTLLPEDIEQLLARHKGGLSVCPAIRDGGTNALVCSPPDAMRFQFGDDSARKHLEQAASQGMQGERLSLVAFFRDIDTPDDLAWLAQQGKDNHTSRFLQQSGIAARLGPGQLGTPA
jgi:2-phospho-L-lactate guanylyltransferase